MTFLAFPTLTATGFGYEKTSVKVPRSSFHTQPKKTGKRFAVANGFAKSARLFPCGNVSGKGCSGKLSPSREGRAAKEQVCQSAILSVVQVAKLLEAADKLLTVGDDVLAQFEGAPPEYGENGVRKIVLEYLEASKGFRSGPC